MSRHPFYKGRELEKSKSWQAILYPDATLYDCDAVLKKITQLSYRFAYILHNQDFFTSSDIDEDDLNSPQDVSDAYACIGKPKKEHIHVVFFWDNTYQLGNIAAKIGLPSNYLQVVKSRSAAIQYLTHKNNPEKHQYNISEIVTNIEKIQSKYFSDDDCVMKASKLLDFIVSYNGVLTITQVAQWSISENCWDEFRRGQHLFTALISEHNYEIKGEM